MTKQVLTDEQIEQVIAAAEKMMRASWATGRDETWHPARDQLRRLLSALAAQGEAQPVALDAMVDHSWSRFEAEMVKLHEAKAQRVHDLVNAGDFPGMSEAFDAQMGAACWTDPDYRQDAALWAAAWKAAKATPPAAAVLQGEAQPVSKQRELALLYADQCDSEAAEEKRLGNDSRAEHLACMAHVLRQLATPPAAPSAEARDAEVTLLPDGSAFATASWPLPKDHWLYAPRGEWDSARDDFAETPLPILTHAQREAVIAAARYAIRGATMCGQEQDFDPDAMVQNFCYALCGPFTALAAHGGAVDAAGAGVGS